MPATGGPSTAIADWSWLDHSDAQLSPDNRLVVFTQRDGGRLGASSIHELATGRQWSLAEPMWHCRWAPDGATVLGTSADGHLALCPADGTACSRLGTGTYPIFGPDRKSIYFLRGVEVWRARRDGSEPVHLATLDGFDNLTFRWGVLPSGELIWNRTVRSSPEVWTASLR
jgi:hypothetical protein